MLNWEDALFQNKLSGCQKKRLDWEIKIVQLDPRLDGWIGRYDGLEKRVGD